MRRGTSKWTNRRTRPSSLIIGCYLSRLSQQYWENAQGKLGMWATAQWVMSWLSLDLIKMFFFSCLYLQRSCRMYCVAFHLLRLFWWQLKDLCVQIFTSLYAECWQKSFSFASGLYFIQWRGFIGKKKCLLCSASCSWQSIHDKTSSRTQISAGGYCNKRHAEKKCLCAFSPLRQK